MDEDAIFLIQLFLFFLCLTLFAKGVLMLLSGLGI
jgi:hypothetical protein